MACGVAVAVAGGAGGSCFADAPGGVEFFTRGFCEEGCVWLACRSHSGVVVEVDFEEEFSCGGCVDDGSSHEVGGGAGDCEEGGCDESAGGRFGDCDGFASLFQECSDCVGEGLEFCCWHGEGFWRVRMRTRETELGRFEILLPIGH